MTLDTYAGLFETDAQALAARMDEARTSAIGVEFDKVGRARDAVHSPRRA